MINTRRAGWARAAIRFSRGRDARVRTSDFFRDAVFLVVRAMAALLCDRPRRMTYILAGRSEITKEDGGDVFHSPWRTGIVVPGPVRCPP